MPYSVSWSAEETMYLAPCRHAGGEFAICQAEARGQGKPRFASPHAQRQREVIAQGLCDLCGRSLTNRTKVSLSHARPFAHAHRPGDVLQVEPLLHRECAALSVKHCPSLRRDLKNGTARIRQVSRYAVQIAIMSAEYCAEVTGTATKAAGHAKVQLLRWVDRDPTWLGLA